MNASLYIVRYVSGTPAQAADGLPCAPMRMFTVALVVVVLVKVMVSYAAAVPTDETAPHPLGRLNVESLESSDPVMLPGVPPV